MGHSFLRPLAGRRSEASAPTPGNAGLPGRAPGPAATAGLTLPSRKGQRHSCVGAAPSFRAACCAWVGMWPQGRWIPGKPRWGPSGPLALAKAGLSKKEGGTGPGGCWGPGSLPCARSLSSRSSRPAPLPSRPRRRGSEPGGGMLDAGRPACPCFAAVRRRGLEPGRGSVLGSQPRVNGGQDVGPRFPPPGARPSSHTRASGSSPPGQLDSLCLSIDGSRT